MSWLLVDRIIKGTTSLLAEKSHWPPNFWDGIRDLRDEPPGDDIGDRNANDVSVLKFFEETAQNISGRCEAGTTITKLSARSGEKPGCSGMLGL